MVEKVFNWDEAFDNSRAKLSLVLYLIHLFLILINVICSKVRLPHVEK